MNLTLIDAKDKDFTKVPALMLEQLQFSATGSEEDPTSRLLGTLQLGPLALHVEAVAVTTNEAGEQVASDATFEQLLESVYAGVEPDKAFQTVEINGRAYVLVATPYC